MTTTKEHNQDKKAIKIVKSYTGFDISSELVFDMFKELQGVYK